MPRVAILSCAYPACLVMQIQRNLSTDSSVQEVQRVSAMVEVDSKAKVGASLGYNVRTLLKDLGLEV